MSETRKKTRILVADDDPAIRILMHESLCPLEVDIVEAEDGSEALALFHRHKPELVVLDVSMPGKDGFEVCRAIRETPEGRDVGIVMVTGLDDMDSIQRAYHEGATDFITKPVNWPIFQHRIRYLLRAQQAFSDLQRSQARLAQAQAIARLGHWEFDPADGALICSREARRILDISSVPAPTEALLLTAQVHPEDRMQVMLARRDALHKGKGYSLDYRVTHRNGMLRYVHEQAEPVIQDGRVVRLSGVVQDITARVQMEERIRRLAYYDSLTGLPNRQHFMEQAGDLLRYREGRPAALVYLDLDRFRYVNDCLGVKAGDLLLRQAAERFLSLVRSAGEEASLWRLSSDQFVFWVPVTEDLEPEAFAVSLLQSLGENMVIGDSDVPVTASIGIAMHPEDGGDVEELLARAHVALREAKKAGGGCYRRYRAELDTHRTRFQMEREIKAALENRQFRLYYQPQFDLVQGRLAGMEALIRWPHERKGMIPPSEFIPVAEETGLIIPLGEWIFESVCRQISAWQARGVAAVPVAVNLSARQLFSRKRLLAQVRKQLADHAISASCLELEITETMLMANLAQALETFDRFRALGLSLAIDDFGTGYSSLSYLQRLPINKLKIDRSFVRGITVGSRDRAIIESLIHLSHNLGLQTVAEGVETREQADILRNLGCDKVQGYFFAPPLPPEEIERQFLVQKKSLFPPEGTDHPS
ncbi:hypothetical protein MIN45_P2018 [Methylomarinovum tepidoasis]|uniref:cyclic-guanylate-specific phosphodiesterase n=1 Tax=Methylomarinovum tepidoasis TaxID=2840183 RepID=A0AAU9C0N5_9GAMM|nr:EAL domain-containing protein [Methylomarinovum sp. IN45]BCX89645.1 hypothetical protein MIN45_P2018 [Methylomarinovum sp. IN45]